METVQVPGGRVPRLPSPKRRPERRSRSRSPKPPEARAEATDKRSDRLSGLHPSPNEAAPGERGESLREPLRERERGERGERKEHGREAVPGSTVAVRVEGFHEPALDGWYRRRDNCVIIGGPAFFHEKEDVSTFMYKQASGRWAISPLKVGDQDLLRAAQEGHDRGVACQKAAKGALERWQEFHNGRWVDTKLIVETFNFEEYEKHARRARREERSEHRERRPAPLPPREASEAEVQRMLLVAQQRARHQEVARLPKREAVVSEPAPPPKLAKVSGLLAMAEKLHSPPQVEPLAAPLPPRLEKPQAEAPPRAHLPWASARPDPPATRAPPAPSSPKSRRAVPEALQLATSKARQTAPAVSNQQPSPTSNQAPRTPPKAPSGGRRPPDGKVQSFLERLGTKPDNPPPVRKTDWWSSGWDWSESRSWSESDWSDKDWSRGWWQGDQWKESNHWDQEWGAWDHRWSSGSRWDWEADQEKEKEKEKEKDKEKDKEKVKKDKDKKDKKERKEKKEKKEKDKHRDKVATMDSEPSERRQAEAAEKAKREAEARRAKLEAEAAEKAKLEADAKRVKVEAEEAEKAKHEAAAEKAKLEAAAKKAKMEAEAAAEAKMEEEADEKAKLAQEVEAEKAKEKAMVPSQVPAESMGGFPASLEGFVRFLREREQIRVRRAEGAPWPWTEDKVLQHLRVRNLHHEEDRSSILIRRLLGSVDEVQQKILNIWLWRRFGSVHFIAALGVVQIPTTDAETQELLRRVRRTALDLWRQGLHSCSDAYSPAKRCHAAELGAWHGDGASAAASLADDLRSGRRRARLLRRSLAGESGERGDSAAAAQAQLLDEEQLRQVLGQSAVAAAAFKESGTWRQISGLLDPLENEVYSAELLRDLDARWEESLDVPLDSRSRRALARLGQEALEPLRRFAESRGLQVSFADLRGQLGEFQRYLRAWEGRPSREPFKPQ